MPVNRESCRVRATVRSGRIFKCPITLEFMLSLCGDRVGGGGFQRLRLPWPRSASSKRTRRGLPPKVLPSRPATAARAS